MMPRENLPCCDVMLVELLNVQATTVRIVTARPPATNLLLLLLLPSSSFASSVSCSPARCCRHGLLLASFLGRQHDHHATVRAGLAETRGGSDDNVSIDLSISFLQALLSWCYFVKCKNGRQVREVSIRIYGKSSISETGNWRQQMENSSA
jgi:hypothetical protein